MRPHYTAEIQCGTMKSIPSKAKYQRLLTILKHTNRNICYSTIYRFYTWDMSQFHTVPFENAL